MHQRISLPSLQVATVAFLAAGARGETYCADSSSTIVTEGNCIDANGDSSNDLLFVVNAEPNLAVGTVLPGNVTTFGGRLLMKRGPEVERGGFGRRDGGEVPSFPFWGCDSVSGSGSGGRIVPVPYYFGGGGGS